MDLQELASVTGIVAAGIGVFRWMLKTHEDVCAERYAGIKSAAEESNEKQDERHEENLQRFMRQEAKLDTIIGHLLKR